MSGIRHFACGYSAFAPGCDSLECLLHRVEVAAVRGWSHELLARRLDAAITAVVESAIGERDETEPARVRAVSSAPRRPPSD